MTNQHRTAAIFMHRLRAARRRLGMTQHDLYECLKINGFDIGHPHRYSDAERRKNGWEVARNPAFRRAAALSVRTPESDLMRGTLPTPCLYCHYAGSHQICHACGRYPSTFPPYTSYSDQENDAL